MYYKMVVAGHTLYYSFHYDRTPEFFGDDIQCCDDYEEPLIRSSEKMIKFTSDRFGTTPLYSEIMCALSLTSNVLLKGNYCSFHSVAFKVNDRGYLLSGKSGVGKSTQYINLKKLYGNRIEIINGDKPILEFKDNQKIIIHPSPWKGKEGFGSDIVCKLDGIIFLKQAKMNRLHRIDPYDAVVKSYGKLLFHPDSADTVHLACELDRKLLEWIPMYEFENTGDLESSKLLFEKLLADGDCLYE